MTINNKNKKVTVLLTGFVVILIFTILSINLSVYFLVGVLFSCGILLIQFGVQLDFENSRYREFISFLGTQKGQWVHIDRKMKLEIKEGTILNPAFSYRTHKTYKIYYHLCLILEGENKTVELNESSDLETLMELRKEYCQKLKLECT